MNDTDAFCVIRVKDDLDNIQVVFSYMKQYEGRDNQEGGSTFQWKENY